MEIALAALKWLTDVALGMKDLFLGFWLAKRGEKIRRQAEELAANRELIEKERVLNDIREGVHGMSDDDLDRELRRVRGQ